MISLPVELLKPIVREAAPAVFAGNEQYKQRRATLLNLCLTSRTFCEIAQPMLAEVLQTRHQPGMGQGRASPPFYPVPKDVGAVIAPQVIALDVLNQHWINGRMPLAYLACTSLRDLSLGGMLIQLRFVAKLPQLRYLALESCEIDLGNYGSMPAFPLVEQLSVSDCVVYHYDYGLGDFFSPKYFPKARAFAVLDTCQDDHKDFPVILPPRDWGDQLDVLAYDSVTAEALSIDGDSTALRRPEVIVLFDLEDFDIRSLPRDAPANICLSIDTTPTSSPLHPRTVTNLTKTLTSLCVAIERLYPPGSNTAALLTLTLPTALRQSPFASIRTSLPPATPSSGSAKTAARSFSGAKTCLRDAPRFRRSSSSIAGASRSSKGGGAGVRSHARR